MNKKILFLILGLVLVSGCEKEESQNPMGCHFNGNIIKDVELCNELLYSEIAKANENCEKAHQVATYKISYDCALNKTCGTPEIITIDSDGIMICKDEETLGWVCGEEIDNEYYMMYGEIKEK